MIFDLYTAIDEDEDVIKYLDSFFNTHTNGDIVSDNINFYDPKSKIRYWTAILVLEKNKVIIRRNTSRNYIIEDIEQCRLIIHEIESILRYFKDARKNGENQYKLALNLPLAELNGEMYGQIKNTCPDIYESITDILKSAKKEIIILNPFFDDEGIDMIGNILAEKARNKIGTVIITRYEGGNNEKNRRLVKKLKNYYSEFPWTLDFLKVYDYKYIDSSENELSFHAKIVMSDNGEKAYLGSANITGRSLELLFEAGVILSDKNSRLLYNVIMNYMKNESFLMQVDI